MIKLLFGGSICLMHLFRYFSLDLITSASQNWIICRSSQPSSCSTCDIIHPHKTFKCELCWSVIKSLHQLVNHLEWKKYIPSLWLCTHHPTTYKHIEATIYHTVLCVGKAKDFGKINIIIAFTSTHNSSLFNKTYLKKDFSVAKSQPKSIADG